MSDRRRWQTSIQSLISARACCAVVLVSLCSCRAPGILRPVRVPANAPQSSAAAPCAVGTVCAGEACGPVKRPRDELICDGGDQGLGVQVAPDWRIAGLDPEDTVVHFDTLDGRTHVEASNKICLYAPRFGAVRVVSGIGVSDQIDRAVGMLAPNRAIHYETREIATTSLQREPLGDHAAAMLPEAFNRRQGGVIVSNRLLPGGFEDTFLPYENLLIMRTGEFDNQEKARLSQAVDAALIWTADQAVQVVIDGKQAKAVMTNEAAQATYMVEDRREAKLRVLKIASTEAAKPGDVIDFTIRFDNIGTAPLGNIVLVDHLTPRLEYVPDSAQSSVKAQFSSQADGGPTIVLRWELEEHLEAGQGGLVRFKCRVR